MGGWVNENRAKDEASRRTEFEVDSTGLMNK